MSCGFFEWFEEKADERQAVLQRQRRRIRELGALVVSYRKWNKMLIWISLFSIALNLFFLVGWTFGTNGLGPMRLS